MKNRNRIIAALFFLGLGFSCTDESTYPINFDQVNSSNGGILSQVVLTSVTFDINDLPNSKYEITLQANDAQRGKLFSSVEIFVRFEDQTPASGNGNNSKSEVKLATYQASEFVVDATTGLPRLTISFTAPATATALGLTIPELQGSDRFVYRHAMIFPDGRVFSASSASTAIAAGGGVYKSPFQSVVPIVCPSDLGGTINYSSTILKYGTGAPGTGIAAGCVEPVTGTTTFDQVETEYSIGDASFGFWENACYGVGAPSSGVTFSDACLALTLGGSDQYGDTYTWAIVSNDGTTLVIDWENTWGDAGRAALTRTGKTWPLGLNIP